MHVAFTYPLFVRFISAPIVIMVASFVIPKYMREKIINGVELAIAFKAHLIFFVSIPLSSKG